MSRQFATICDIFCPVPFLPSPFGFRRLRVIRLFYLKFPNSEKLEEAGTVDFKKHPARKVGTRCWQCRPKVPGGFAFPCARNPRISSISRFGKNVPAIFPGLSQTFPREPSGLKVRRAKSAAKNPKITSFFFGIVVFELDLVGWSAVSVTRVLHEGCQAQWM